jgi:hypothetical protein
VPMPDGEPAAPGVVGNERVTALAGAVLLALISVEVVTLPNLRELLSVHVLVGRSDYRKWTPDVVEAALRRELRQPKPTLAALERRLRCDRRTLRKHQPQPQLSTRVVAAGRERRAALDRERVVRLANEVEAAVHHLVVGGLLPTASRVSALLARPGGLRHPAARQALRAAVDTRSAGTWSRPPRRRDVARHGRGRACACQTGRVMAQTARLDPGSGCWRCTYSVNPLPAG